MQQEKTKSGKISNTTAGTVGAVVGGVVGAAAGVALSDTKRRKIILEKMEALKKYINATLDEIADISQEQIKQLPKNLPSMPLATGVKGGSAKRKKRNTTNR